MRDSQGRTIDYMRISITDRCNLRCRYCMPENPEHVPVDEMLTFEEITKAVRCSASLGIRYIKITGGEPLVRKGCPGLVKMIKEVPGIEKVTLTTNGILLKQYLGQLIEAGIDGINISLDTLDGSRYREITGRDSLPEVVSAIKTASASSVPIKINTVSLSMGFGKEWDSSLESEGNDWEKMTEIARDYPVDVRFIEMMPIGYGKQFTTVNHGELLKEMKQHYPEMEKDNTLHGFGPAVYYKIPGFLGSIGFISAIHGKFCNRCNRIRLTSKGYLKTCLCYEAGADLRPILRSGLEEKELEKQLSQVMKQAVMEKPAAHCFENPGQVTEQGNMSMIGG